MLRAIALEPLLPTDDPGTKVAAEIIRGAPAAKSVALNIEAVVEGQLALYRRTPATLPWIGYLARDAQSGEPIGSCSFIRDDAVNSVEIAYFTFPPYEGNGVATEMARQLLAIAAKSGDPDLHAFTLPHENASTRILRKLEFEQVGDAQDDDAGPVWRWERRRGSPPRRK